MKSGKMAWLTYKCFQKHTHTKLRRLQSKIITTTTKPFKGIAINLFTHILCRIIEILLHLWYEFVCCCCFRFEKRHEFCGFVERLFGAWSPFFLSSVHIRLNGCTGEKKIREKNNIHLGTKWYKHLSSISICVVCFCAIEPWISYQMVHRSLKLYTKS